MKKTVTIANNFKQCHQLLQFFLLQLQVGDTELTKKVRFNSYLLYFTLGSSKEKGLIFVKTVLVIYGYNVTFFACQAQGTF